MTSGLTCSPSRYSLRLPARGLGTHKKQIMFLSSFGISVGFYSLQRNGLAASTCSKKQRIPLVKCAMDATFGDANNDSPAIFPRINVRDPYKRLGINREASEDEIQAARNFLIQAYGGHKPSVDAIEAAHDKIIMQKFYERRNPKIDMEKKVREVTQHRYVQAVTSRFRTPSTSVIVKTSIAFVVLGALTVLFPTEEGPTLQGWEFCFFMASRNIFDGFCDAADTPRAKKLGSDDFIDKLHYPLGFLYVSPIISSSMLITILSD